MENYTYRDDGNFDQSREDERELADRRRDLRELADPDYRLRPLEPSTREKQVIIGIARGLQNKLIADELGISINTVLCHRRRVMMKLDMHSAGELTRYAVSRKWV